MSDPTPQATRADAARNRAQLLKVAARAFAATDSDTSMRAIARQAGVGIGTLYRHFPNRESLVEAVYRDQVVGLVNGAQQLLAEASPAVALRSWMDLFGEWIATKSGMLDTMLAMIEAGDLAHARTRDDILAAITAMLDAGRATGDLRADVSAEEVAAVLIGIFTVAHQSGPAVSADRLLDIFLDGLRPPLPPPHPAGEDSQ